jgi:hypothetical protein
VNFLTRFVKIYLFALILSALGGFAFYLLVIKGSRVRDDVSYAEFVSTVKLAIGVWVGFVTFISLVLAATGMKTTASVPVHDRDGFLHKFDAAVRGLRYRPQTQSEGLLVYKPPAGQFLAEKITAELQPGGALVTAPRLLLRKIQEKLY